jgi:hypothetical protein
MKSRSWIFSDDKTVEIAGNLRTRCSSGNGQFRDQYQHVAGLTSHPWSYFWMSMKRSPVSYAGDPKVVDGNGEGPTGSTFIGGRITSGDGFGTRMVFGLEIRLIAGTRQVGGGLFARWSMEGGFADHRYLHYPYRDTSVRPKG